MGNDRLNSYEENFKECVRDIEVEDLNFSGSLFSWSNKQEGSAFVAKKLDRILVNEFWMENFGNTLVEFFEGGVSDHAYMLVSVGSVKSFGPKPFKFFSYWTENPQFLQWVTEGWESEVEGFPKFCLYSKLKAVKDVLKNQNRVCYGNSRRFFLLI